MKLFFLMTLVAGVLLSVSPIVQTGDREFKGHITDTMCGSDHMMDGMDAKQCADECVRLGSTYALYVTADEKIYDLDDQEEAKKFSGEAVVVKGALNEDGKSIEVASIERQEKASP